MWFYFIKRILLIPLTLFCIVLVNFLIVNMAPGEPTTMTDISSDGASRRADKSQGGGGADRYLQFREFYGLTLPLLFNTWPFLTSEYVHNTLEALAFKQQDMSVKDYDSLRILFGDQARFVMADLLHEIENPNNPPEIKSAARKFFNRGAFRLGIAGSNLTPGQKRENRKIADDMHYLNSGGDPREWFEKNRGMFSDSHPYKTFFFETRFFKYLSRVLTLDFGVMRNDPNKTVISEVVKRFKYSLTLSVIPMVITFILCLFIGFLMAFKHETFIDYSLNMFFLILYAIPIFVAVPFLIEKVALNHYFPFTNIPIPINGFSSPDNIYNRMTSSEKLFDILRHIALPLLAILYGGLAAQSRLARTAVLEVKRQDYVRTAVVKGADFWSVLFKHVGRNASITLVTSIAGSLGVVLGGSLIVETLFEIDGFGKFFYDAVLNRDYNVIMFSALAGSFLTLVGYLVADIAYMFLDPRVTLHE
jgi:peptide/nickel transport system permease protein